MREDVQRDIGARPVAADLAAHGDGGAEQIDFRPVERKAAETVVQAPRRPDLRHRHAGSRPVGRRRGNHAGTAREIERNRVDTPVPGAFHDDFAADTEVVFRGGGQRRGQRRQTRGDQVGEHRPDNERAASGVVTRLRLEIERFAVQRRRRRGGRENALAPALDGDAGEPPCLPGPGGRAARDDRRVGHFERAQAAPHAEDFGRPAERPAERADKAVVVRAAGAVGSGGRRRLAQDMYRGAENLEAPRRDGPAQQRRAVQGDRHFGDPYAHGAVAPPRMDIESRDPERARSAAPPERQTAQGDIEFRALGRQGPFERGSEEPQRYRPLRQAPDADGEQQRRNCDYGARRPEEGIHRLACRVGAARGCPRPPPS